MSRKDVRPPLGGLTMDDDVARIRDFGLSRGFLPTDPQPAAVPVPPPKPAVPATPVAEREAAPAVVEPAPVASDGRSSSAAAGSQLISRPASTKPWQAMLPDYLIDALRQAAAAEGTAQKVIVLRALKAAGFRVDDIDLQDLRKR